MWWPEASAAASRPRGDARRDADRAKDAKPVKRLSEAVIAPTTGEVTEDIRHTKVDGGTRK